MNRDVGVYVHIPFCARKCHYCDFVAYAGITDLVDPYIDAVLAESRSLGVAPLMEHTGSAERPDPKASARVDLVTQGGFDARTLYFGGGTPTILQPKQIERLLRGLPEVQPSIEVTIEANPGGVDLAYLRCLRCSGFNRLSLGAQSFDGGLLRRLGRLHTAGDVVTSYEAARRVGFSNVSLDLIYGLPDQDLVHWRTTLERALALGPEHLSLYPLTIEEKTVFGRMVRQGALELPDEDRQAEMYLLAEDLLGTAGYAHYEISNWALPSYESQHNLVYWRNKPYIGLGAGAHSSLDGERNANVARVREYVLALDERRSPVAYSEPIDLELEKAETLMLGLRLAEGVAFDSFAQRFGSRLEEQYADRIAELIAVGLLSKTADRIALTARGRLLGNEVFRRFLPREG